MVQVLAKRDESFESLFRRFKKLVERSGILSDFKKSAFYEKPSVKRKHKAAAARKRALKRKKKLEKYRERETGNQNFRFNKNKTKKILTTPYKNSGPGYKGKNRNHNNTR